MKQTTKVKIEYMNRRIIGIEIAQRKADQLRDELEKWLESNSAELNEYTQSLILKSNNELNRVCYVFMAEQMLIDELPYNYISRFTGLTKQQLYTLKSKLIAKGVIK